MTAVGRAPAPLRFGSLFSGIGGLDLGLEWAGMECAWQSEIDPYASRVLAKHWPHVPNIGDIKAIDPETLPPVDLVCGGFPCTQTSLGAAIHGKRLGLDGEQSGLWFEMLRIVRGAAPSWVLVENTGGVLRWADEIQNGLEACGYTVSREILKACYFGAPHERRRVFFIANRDGKRLEVARPSGPPTPAGNPWSAPPRGAWREDHAGACGVDDGPSARMDRIACCGRAVMPVMGLHLGRAIVAAHYEALPAPAPAPLLEAAR